VVVVDGWGFQGDLVMEYETFLVLVEWC